MNQLFQTCKCHWVGEENRHWGHGSDRRAFMPPGTPLRFAPDPSVTGRHLKVALHLDFATERAWGRTTHECEVRGEPVSMVHFDGIALDIERVRVNGRAASFENDGRRIAVHLPRAFSRGKTFRVELDHSVTRPAAGLYFTNPDPAYPDRFQTAWSQGQDEDSRYYFPCLDAPRFKQTTEALLHVPEGFFALSNGELVQHVEKAGGGEARWHYRFDLPTSTYLFSIVAGEFTGHREKAHGTDVRWFVQPGREDEGRNAFANTGDILAFFSRYTGVPYPYSQYTQIAVPDFIFGGMENFTVTTQTDLTLHDARAHLDFSSDDLVAHEAAHSWFGNLVTARDWAHAWLHESFATYMECLYLREAKGRDEYDFQLLRDAEAYFHEDGQYRRPIVTQRYEEPIDLFDAHLYPGGAVRLRNLHALLGEETFRAVLKRFLEAHRFGVAETVDLARAVETETGVNYDPWFDQWILSAGYPAIEVGFTWQEKDRMAVVTMRQTQPLTDPSATGGASNTKSGRHKQYFRLPTRIAFHVGGKMEEFPITLEAEEHRFVFRLPARPRMVLFDPHYECPARKVTYRKPEDLLLNELNDAPRPVSRIEAAAALAEKPSRRVVDALGRRLAREPFWGVRQRIARALGKIGGEAARDALLRAIAQPHPKVRREVIATLGYFRGDAKVGAALARKARRGDDSYYVEAETARALGRCRAPQAAPLLESFLERESHVEVIRTAAFDALAELGLEESLPKVLEGMRYGAPAMSRPAAMRAGAELALRHPHRRQEVVEALEQAVEHRDNPAGAFRGKIAALRALERLGRSEVLPVLNRVAANETDGRIVRQARLCVQRVRQGLERPVELRELRDDLDNTVKEHKALRDRLGDLEERTRKAPTQKGKGRSRKN